MKTTAQKKILRDNVKEKLASLKVDDFDFYGMSKDGPIFTDGEIYFTTKVIVHKEDFDADDKVDEYNEAQAREEERAKKKAEKLAKAKAKEEEGE